MISTLDGSWNLDGSIFLSGAGTLPGRYAEFCKQPVKYPSAIVKLQESSIVNEQTSQSDWAANTGSANVDWTTMPGDVQLASPGLPQEKNLTWNSWFNLITVTSLQGKTVDNQTWQSFKLNTGTQTQRQITTVQGYFYAGGNGSYDIYCQIWSANKGSQVGSTVGPVNLASPNAGATLTFDFTGQNLHLSDNTEYWLKFYAVDRYVIAGQLFQAYQNSNVYVKGQFDSTGTNPGTNLGDLYFNTVITGYYYATSGWLQTQNMDLGQTPTDEGEWIINDIVPQYTTLTYLAWGSDTGAFSGEEVSIGSINDGDAITMLKRYYRVKASLGTTDQAFTPAIQSIKAFYPTFSAYSDTFRLGFEPSVLGISSLTSNIDTFQPSSIGQITIRLAMSKRVSTWLKSRYPKNKIVKALIGFNAEGFAVEDYINFFIGGVDDWSIDEKDCVSIKCKDFKKDWAVNIPEKWSSTLDDITWTALHPIDVMRDILMNRIGIRDSKFDLSGFDAVKAALPGWKVTRTITDNAENAGSLVEELRLLMSCFFIPQADGRIRIKRWDPNEPAVDDLDDDNTLSIVYQGNAGGSGALINRYLHYYGWDGNGDNAANFSALYVDIDPASQTNWGAICTKEIKDKWTQPTESAQIADLAANILNRYANPPEVFIVTVTRDRIGLEVGNVVNLTTKRAPSIDMTGIVNNRYQIISRDLDFAGDVIKLKLMRV